jgi:hypothetical protein
MKASVEIQGFEAAIKALDVLPDKFQRQTILAMFRRSTRPMIRAARSKLLSYGSEYNKLSKSIGNITAKSRNAIIYVGPRIKGKWKTIGYIAHWVEYGTRGVKKSRGGTARTDKDKEFGKWVSGIALGGSYREDQPAKPFMRPAIDSQSGNVAKLVSTNFEKHLDKTVKRLLKKV